jgi:hypothetical protein
VEPGLERRDGGGSRRNGKGEGGRGGQDAERLDDTAANDTQTGERLLRAVEAEATRGKKRAWKPALFALFDCVDAWKRY